MAELRRDWQVAIKELDRAAELNASDAETQYDLGKAELAIGNTADAISELETAVHLMANNAEYHQELGNAYERAFRMADAEREQRTAKQLQSGAAPAAQNGASTTETSPGR